MAKKSKLNLINDDLTWNADRRYKVNSVVQLNGEDYQNITGKNSNPELLIDWQKIYTDIAISDVTGLPTALDDLSLELQGKKNKTLAVVTEPSITKILASTDECIVFTNANPVTFTVPTNASVPIPIGTEVQYTQQGNGVVTVGGAGITFVTNLALAMVKGETRTLTKIGTDTWTVEGNIIDDSQIEVFANTTVLEFWNKRTILFTANCTITVPATLLPHLGFVFRTLAGVTVTWAITAPFTWETTPTTTPEKTTGSFMRRGITNTILLDF